MPMHAAMPRVLSALLAVCISVCLQPASLAQPALSAQPASMPPKRKKTLLAMRGKPSSAPAHSKRTTLDLRGKHHINQRALAHVCKDIRANGLVKAISARTMMRNRGARVNQVTPFGTLIQEQRLVTNKGRSIKIPFLHPAAMLWDCYKKARNSGRSSVPSWRSSRD